MDHGGSIGSPAYHQPGGPVQQQQGAAPGEAQAVADDSDGSAPVMLEGQEQEGL
eukprot:gene10954-9573_t